MTGHDQLVFYHAPNTRSSGTFILLEELGCHYEMRVLNMKAGEQRQPAYLAVNPMGKVPAIVHNGALVTEQVAVFLYLADAYPQKRLAPPIGDPLRGPYLRWMTYYAACFEPAVIDKYRKLEPAPQGMLPYGDFDTMLRTLTDQLAKGPYLLGDTFTAADILWGTGLTWTIMFGLVPKLPVIEAYMARLSNRPSLAKVQAKDAELAAQHAAAAPQPG